MKHQNIIKHTLKREGSTISGQILEVNWGTYEDYGGYNCALLGRGSSAIIKISSTFRLSSCAVPQIDSNVLYIHGDHRYADDRMIGCFYDSEERAKEVMELINLVSYDDTTKRTKEEFIEKFGNARITLPGEQIDKVIRNIYKIYQKYNCLVSSGAFSATWERKYIRADADDFKLYNGISCFDHPCLKDDSEYFDYTVKEFLVAVAKWEGGGTDAVDNNSVQILKDNQLCVHLPRLSLWKKAMRFFKKNGVRKSNGDKFENVYVLWRKNRKDSCIAFEDGVLTFGHINYYKNRRHHRITVEELLDLDNYFADNFNECDICGDTVHDSTMQEVNGQFLCEMCVENYDLI